MRPSTPVDAHRRTDKKEVLLVSMIKERADAILPEIVEIRRTIHRNPEIGRHEFKTSALIREKLAEIGVDKIESPVPTAVVALINGAKGTGKCVALRCDIDALPVQEETGLPYASEIPDMMHACGHDIHASMMLGVAKLLCGMRDQFAGCVKLIFQHSEDTLPGGARELVEHGVLETPHVDAIFGMHVMPDAERVGQIGVYAGPITTSVDLYDFTVSGIGGHGSQPQNTTDPLLTAAQTVVMLQQIVARRTDPMEMAVLSLGSIHGGDAPNVIPAEVKFGGVSRAYSETVRQTIKTQAEAIAAGMSAASGNKVELHYADGYPSAYNDEKLIDLASAAIRAELGEDAVVPLPGPMGFSEDFSFYETLGRIPGAFLMLYAGYEGVLAPLHNPKCCVKEAAMPYGMSAMTAIALAYLKA